MKTLATGGIDLSGVPRIMSVVELAEMLGVKPRQVHSLRELGVIVPLPSVDRLQFDRAAYVRARAFEVLQEGLGAKSALPGEIVREVGADLDKLAAGPWMFAGDAERAVERGFKRVVDAFRDRLAPRLSTVASA